MEIQEKIAILSHILPPALSGQSVLLSRLLSQSDKNKYCLLSSGKPVNETDGVSKPLKGEYVFLKQAGRLLKVSIPVISWPSLLFGSFLGVYSRAKEVASTVQEKECKLIIGCTGDLLDMPAAWLASRWLRIPFIAYIMDDYVYQWVGARRFLARMIERFIIKDADKVFVLNEFVQRNYRERYGIEAHIIHNPVVLPDVYAVNPNYNSRSFNIVYTGSVYHAHFDAFRNLVRALECFVEKELSLHVYTPQPESLFIENGLLSGQVKIYPPVSQEDVGEVLAKADMLFLPLAFESLIPEVIHCSAPFKMSEYLSSKKPILVHAPRESFLTWYFSKYHCGVVVDRNDPGAIYEALKRVFSGAFNLAELANNARVRAECDFDINKIRPEFIRAVNHVAMKQ